MTVSKGDNPVLCETDGDIFRLTLNRPLKLNALNPQVFEILRDRIRDFEADAEARVLILSGEGRCFAAGADIEHYVDRSHDEYLAFMNLGRSVLDGLAECEKPVIAAVHGFALGGGFELVLACDLVVAAENARFGLPEPRLGLLPGGGGTQRLPRVVGRHRASELLMTGRFLTAQEGAEWGFVNQVVPRGDHVEAANEMARLIIERAPRAIGMAKRLVRDGLEVPLDVALTMERDTTSTLYLTNDAREGIAAFVEKREPEFGR